MAQDSGFPLSSEPPAGWAPKSAYSVQLTVTMGEGGDPVFSYSDPLFGPDSPLDLKVVEDCMILLECDESQGLSWSLGTDAISLKDSGYVHLYFALRYVDRGISFRRGEFPSGRKCTQICFGAQLNVADPAHYRHPFNLYVDFARNGQMIPIHIDPDIQNPKV